MQFDQIAEYKKNPLKYAQGLLDEGDKLYDKHKENIRVAKGHLMLESDHLTARAAIGDRSAHYFPEITPAVRARAANIFDVFTSSAPSLRLSPSNVDLPGARESADKLERWLNYCHKSKVMWLDWYLSFLSAEIFPYAVVYLRWDDNWGRVPHVNQMGGISYDDMITYSGPAIDILSPEDYRGDLYAKRKEWMTYHIFTKEVDEHYLKRGHRAGHYPNFNQLNISQAKAGDWMNKRRQERFNKYYAKPLGYEYEFIVSLVLVHDENTGEEEWREITFCGDMLLNERPAPMAGEDKPPFFILNSFPLPGEIAGLSTALLGEANQNMMNELWNQHIEANEQSIWAPTLYSGEITSNPVWEPMALWEVANPDSFRPLIQPRLAGDLLGSIKFLQERDQNMLAAWDIIQPVTESSKQTASEYLGKKETYSKVLGVNLQFYAAEVVAVNEMILKMARSRMTDWLELGLLGGNPALSSLTVQDIATDVDVEVPNVRQLSMEGMEMSKWDVMYPILMNNPIVVSNPANLYELTKRYLIAHQEKDINKLIGEQANVSQANMMIPSGGM